MENINPVENNTKSVDFLPEFDMSQKNGILTEILSILIKTEKGPSQPTNIQFLTQTKNPSLF